MTKVINEGATHVQRRKICFCRSWSAVFTNLQDPNVICQLPRFAVAGEPLISVSLRASGSLTVAASDYGVAGEESCVFYESDVRAVRD